MICIWPLESADTTSSTLFLAVTIPVSFAWVSPWMSVFQRLQESWKSQEFSVTQLAKKQDHIPDFFTSFAVSYESSDQPGSRFHCIAVYRHKRRYTSKPKWFINLRNCSYFILDASCFKLKKLYWFFEFLYLKLLEVSVHCSNNECTF